MLYSSISFNYFVHMRMAWNIQNKLTQKFCNAIKKQYGVEWTYGLGDHGETYITFRYDDTRKIDERLFVILKAKVKTLGQIYNITTFSSTHYHHSILKQCGEPKSLYSGWHRKIFFLDCAMFIYRKHIGSKWYIHPYKTIPHQYQYAQLVQVKNYK